MKTSNSNSAPATWRLVAAISSIVAQTIRDYNCSMTKLLKYIKLKDGLTKELSLTEPWHK
eukprot:4771916-Amphidinium_carterae.1